VSRRSARGHRPHHARIPARKPLTGPGPADGKAPTSPSPSS